MKLPVSIRTVGWLLALALVALPVVGLMRGWFASDRWPIRTLQVQASYRHVSAATLRATVAPYLHKGFFATHLGKVQQAVSALPWVASVEVRKVWPDTLDLRVHERRPAAHWDGTRLIDVHGEVFSAPGAAAIGGLPQLSGPDARVDDVIAFYRKVKARFGSVGLHVTGVSLSGRNSWRVGLGNGAAVEVGTTNPEQRLGRFLDVYPRLVQGHDDRFAYVDLRYTNGFAVRWSKGRSGQALNADSGGSPQT